MAADTQVGREKALLNACLADDVEFAAIFSQFDSDDNLDSLTWGELRLIPYLFRKLERLEIATPRFAIYKGIYTKFWYIHKMERDPTVPYMIKVLKDFEFMFIKGSALQPLVFGGDPVTRPGDDIDILVRPADRIRIIESLLTVGFEPDEVWPQALVRNLKLSIGLSKGAHHVDVHWGLYPSAGPVAVADQLFTRQTSIQNGTNTFNTLSVSDHLLHNLVHGQVKNQVSPIRWVLDCALLARHPESDWHGFVEAAQEWGWQEVARDQLQILAREYNLAVPSFVLDSLKVGSNAWPLRLYQANRGLPPSITRGLISLVVANPLNLRELSSVRSAPHVVYLVRALAIWWSAWLETGDVWNRVKALLALTRK